MAILLDGKKAALGIKEEIKKDVLLLKEKGKGVPVLACISVGADPASCVYIKSQSLAARELGIGYSLISLKEDITQEDLIAEVARLNTDKGVHAIIIQSPLPKNVNVEEVSSCILPSKDAEGMHPENLGRLLLGQGSIAPCTAAACMELLRRYKIKLYGKEVVIVGHSNIVGKPLSMMMLRGFATTTVCHIATSEAHQLESHVRRAEILIVAVGKPGLIKGDWIEEGAVVLDVGINRAEGRIVGDVEFDAASKKAAYITPVPGGVGPLTVTMLMHNTLRLFEGYLVS
ncbi:MAG: bifunctional 5,10-methylenetetrahydrofolate dehydrogenase/5,10-methenyltetrahydrofolate cyclohydrolase [Candidatus Omnitrophica bacterium]|nr:bifunctional 5,10-methylenetetrahydrofolate dehydrogenase/5,10-methenyltetrahydrofolate cyclohydrolase [Candidatus Omnitrophota bacterium]